MRDWADSSKKSKAVVDRTEDQRIEVMANSFEVMGYCLIEAKILGRISYFSQIGYLAMRINDPLDERLNNLPYYAKIQTGHDVFAGCKTTADVKAVVLSCGM